MALLFEPESLEWPSLTEGDSCKENEFLIIAWGPTPLLGLHLQSYCL